MKTGSVSLWFKASGKMGLQAVKENAANKNGSAFFLLVEHLVIEHVHATLVCDSDFTEIAGTKFLLILLLWHFQYFIILLYYCASQILQGFFFFLTNWRFVATLCLEILSDIFPTAFAHFMSLCPICYGDLWSVIFGVTMVIVWVLMSDLRDKCCMF